jgi:hypothetical protein
MGECSQTEQRARVPLPPPPMLSGVLQRKCACGGTPGPDGECSACRAKRLNLQQPASALATVREVPSPGQTLDRATRDFISPQSGHDFGQVQVHRRAAQTLQPKLSVSHPGDPYEQEADRVADQVMRRVEPRVSCSSERISVMPKGLDGGSCDSAPSGEQGVDAEEDEEQPSVMPHASNGGLHEPGGAIEQRLSLTRGGGSPLAPETRSFMESRFGHDFSRVQVHTDHHAATLAAQLNAEAFTSGRDIYFGAGRFTPTTPAGKWLLAHELTHVLQQGAGSSERNPIQRFSLNGFPPAKEAAMNAAVPKAISTVKSCSKLSWYGKSEIPKALDFVRYDFVPDLGLCGWTFPVSWYIEVGEKAFDSSRCCDLPSTLAHEAAHTVGYTESSAREMECDCFGCSCS